MIATAPVPTSTAEAPPAQDAANECECFTVDQIMEFVRTMAAGDDWHYAHIHRQASLNRVRAGARIAQSLIETHLELRRRIGRNARTGRRKHAQAVYDLLDQTNAVDLQLAVAVLSIPFLFSTEHERND